MATKAKAQRGKRVAASRRVPAPLPRKRHSCIVLGAGLAGLAAAHRLTEKGWDVTVVEAQRERLGGRVFSHQFDEDRSLVCELGGEWIGKDHKEMLRLCRFFSLPKMRHRYAYSFWEGEKPLRFTPPGKWALSGSAKKGFDQLRNQYDKYGNSELIEMDKLDWWTQLDGSGFKLNDLLQRDLMDSTDFGESIRQVSAYVGASEYFGTAGVGADTTDEMDYKLVGGNSTLVYALADSVGRRRIHKGFVVRKIYQDSTGVEVSSSKGTLKAEVCICALPAHQLPRINWGRADLPEDHRDAARQLQYARITKTAVLCSERFWPKPPRGGFSLFTSLASDFCFDSTAGQKGGRGILCSYAIGDKADDIAASPIRKLKNWIAGDVATAAHPGWTEEQLKKISKIALNAKRQAWQNDRFTRGAYAFYRPGQWFTIRPILQRPHRKVFFAGEHIADEQGFMEGAVVTGRNAADNL
jgi:monoamine oxidase